MFWKNLIKNSLKKIPVNYQSNLKNVCGNYK